MDITDVKIFKAKKRGPVLAYANIIIDNKFIIRGITLIEKGKRRYVSMPARKIKGEGKKYRDVCHPLNNELRRNLTIAIFEAYDEFEANEL